MNIAVLVSGGVDSSVALQLLKEQGHELTAFYLKIWLEDELSFLGSCPWEEDLAYVRATCDQLNIPLRIVNLQEEYKNRIVSYVLSEIKAGRTPNPDVLCNKHIKFGAFLDTVGSSFDYVATGHYAQVDHTLQGAVLRLAPDAIKDQTYFLAYMTAMQLSKALFPIGHLTKAQVRELAHQYNLPAKDRKDSQGICFLGKIKFSDFLKHHCGEQPGDLVEFETGKKLGTHPGFFYYTLGQRQGTGLAGGPWYVVRKDPSGNVVFVSRQYYASDKSRNLLEVHLCNWFTPAPTPGQSLYVKLRHGPKRYTCTVQPVGAGRWAVQLGEHDQGIAPGQFAVFYDGDRCIGACVIAGSSIA